ELGHINPAFNVDDPGNGLVLNAGDLNRPYGNNLFYITHDSQGQKKNGPIFTVGQNSIINNGSLPPKVPEVSTPSADDSNEEEERDTWGNPIEFLLSCISMSVGLGNVWRFPFVAYENGVGYGSMVGTFVVVSFYVSLMGLTIYYFFASFAAVLPWAQCDPAWAGEAACEPNSTYLKENNLLIYIIFLFLTRNEVFPQKANIDDGIGYPGLYLSLCLLLSWVIIFLSLVKGVKGSGKVAYFTAIFPYVVLFILLIRGVTLPGAWSGILFFITPQWHKIYDPNVWYAAVSQCFFSLSTGFGPIIMFSSYNPFTRNVYKDAFIISLMDTFTSLLAGFTIFAILGSLATQLDVDITVVAKSGPGLAFISYPDAISKFDWVPQLFAVLFFLMLFTLGVGSATSLAGGIITIFCDQFPSIARWQATTAICIIGFFSGLIYVTPGGQFMLTLADYFGASFVIYVMAIVEVTAVSWVYGLNNLCRDIEFMLGIKLGFYWKFCWGFFIPVALIVILVYTLVTATELTHNGVNYPPVAIGCGWALAAIALSLLPLWAIHAVFTRKSKTFLGKLKESFQPTEKWGPKSPKIRAQWMLFKQQKELENS
ncbi:Sodium-dependent nutrient amino acid transporter 1, partial [Orchesella cincta]